MSKRLVDGIIPESSWGSFVKLSTIRIRQAGRTLFIGTMTAGEMLDQCITYEWDPSLGWDLENQGYQRAPNEKHFRAIAEYLIRSGTPFLPTGALLSAREADYGLLKFRVTDTQSGTEFGELIVPAGRQLFIVDYQHRWRAFRYAVEDRKQVLLRDTVIPVTIMADVSRREEIEQFFVINSKQRRIDTDLALALLQTMATEATEEELRILVGAGKRYRIRATRLTFRIAARAKGPWAGRIRQPHAGVDTGVLSVKSFADSLRPVISPRSSVASLTDNELIQMISEYWGALAELIPEAFADPKNFLIQKTPGAFAMHLVAARYVFPQCQAKRSHSLNIMKRIVQKVDDSWKRGQPRYLDPDFWVAGGPVRQYASSAGQRYLASDIVARLSP